MNISVRGMRRTGNNFLIQILRNNLRDIKIHGTSHVPFRPNDSDKDIIVIIKNPYSWFLSIKKWAKTSWHKNNEFLNWKTNWSWYTNLYDEYNEFYRGYLGKKNVFCLQYENLLRDPNRTIEEICSNFNVKRQTNLHIPKEVPQSTKFTKERKKFYLGNSDFGLAKPLIQKISDVVDWDTVSMYGYVKLEI